ncbi:hypothetical protein MAHJHV28_45590 [Mycobacterium avium subsp. hominissuis]
MGDPATNSAGRSRPQRSTTGSLSGPVRQAEFVAGSPIQVVDRVQWFAVRPDPQSAGAGCSSGAR